MEGIDFSIDGRPSRFELESKTLTVDSQDFVFPLIWATPKRRLYMILSMECNLRCTYCFQHGARRTGKALDENHVHEIIRSLQNEVEEIILFGGEPFLPNNFELIESIFERFDYLSFNAFSNGNFDSSYCNLLKRYAHIIKRVVITLDGPKDIHNKRRSNPKQDSFETIIENLGLLGQTNVPLSVQITVDTQNINSLDPLMQMITESEILAKLSYMLSPVKYSKSSISLEQLFSIYFSLKARYPVSLTINNRLIGNLSNLLSHKPLLRERCGFDSHYVLNFQDGTVYGCPQNECTQIGNILDKKIFVNRDAIHELVLQTAYKTNECTDCCYSFICPYGCPFETKVEDCRKAADALLSQAFRSIELLADLSFLRHSKAS